jgi:UDP-N-acetylglucosamine--N-acetylmuramyl-(pentapeptide) pyrophosphoryl-undecaprenol N-acetylglucosamine transferase
LKSKKLVVIFAGGGTGGHLYPGIAVARELQRQRPDAEIHFVGSHQGLENKIIPKEGFPLHTLPVGGLIRTDRLSQLKTLLLMPWVFLKSLLICLKLKPQIILGVGGFAAGPFVLMGSFLVRNTYIWEPNAHPGFTNRVLSRFVKKAFVVFDVAKKSLKSSEILSVGLPIRNNIGYRPRMTSKIFRIFVFGGSQGARGINNAVCEAVLKGGDWLNDVEIVHQTGKLDFERISKAYHNNSRVKALEFIDDMPKFYGWADLLICRGGVGTISELIATRKAAIIIPLPTAAENHQQSNAEVLVNAQAGDMLLQKDLTPETLISRILLYKNDPKKIEQIEKNLARLERPSGSATIVSEMLKDLNT